MENINLPVKVRFALYVLTSLGSLVTVYLSATGSVGQDLVTLLAGVTTFVAGLAAYNTQGVK